MISNPERNQKKRHKTWRSKFLQSLKWNLGSNTGEAIAREKKRNEKKALITWIQVGDVVKCKTQLCSSQSMRGTNWVVRLYRKFSQN